jgi:hypothetical protein
MQRRSGRRSAGQHERGERGERGVERVDLLLDPLDLRGADAQTLAAGGLGGGDIGTKVEEIVLDAGEHRLHGAERHAVQTRQPDGGVGLVDGADGGKAQVGFRPPLAGGERGGAVIARAGVDAVEDNHQCEPK